MFRLTAAIPSAVLAASIAALSTASLSKHTLDRLTARFERAGGSADGSGLGLAIVAAITDRIESPLVLRSPRPGASSGFEAFVGTAVEN
jgi:two-component system OmpR family sensor kinase